MTATEQPVGQPLDWTPATPPDRTPIPGRYVTLEPLDPDRHGADLWAAKGDDPALWTYLFNEPHEDFASFKAWLIECQKPDDPLCFVIVDNADGRAKGMASYMRIVPEHGVIEIGSIWFGPEIQRSRQATEAIYLLARHVFEALGYRRLEWKCDSLNAPSRRAANRFGFSYEGLFRQAIVYKGRNRDTAWFSMLDGEWPEIRAAFDAWLDPANFDADGRQKEPLRARREAG
jgi:RimJ/RimL family protein N-acetyltransferase